MYLIIKAEWVKFKDFVGAIFDPKMPIPLKRKYTRTINYQTSNGIYDAEIWILRKKEEEQFAEGDRNYNAAVDAEGQEKE